MNPESFIDPFYYPGAWYHGGILSLKILMSSEDFQGNNKEASSTMALLPLSDRKIPTSRAAGPKDGQINRERN